MNTAPRPPAGLGAYGAGGRPDGPGAARTTAVANQRKLRYPTRISFFVTPLEAMDLALAEARVAASVGEVPVGAIALGPDGSLLARRHNEREVSGDPTAHAEILVLRDAASALGTWRLSDVTVVVTLEPCPMCAGALVAARVRRVVFGAPDPKAGATGSLYNLCADPRLNHEVEVVHGVRAAESATLLEEFFGAKRSG
jgi:tRNA(adenine34) deaminase